VTAARAIRGRGIVHGTAAGPALVSHTPLNFLGDLDIRTGMVVADSSDVAGRSVAGTVLFIPISVGSAGAWRFLYQLGVHGTKPVAIITMGLPDSSLVQGAILAKVPIVCEPEEDVLETIATGDRVEVDGTAGLLRVGPA
jgi:predicted aconitase with swiveling domain